MKNGCVSPLLMLKCCHYFYADLKNVCHQCIGLHLLARDHKRMILMIL